MSPATPSPRLTGSHDVLLAASLVAVAALSTAILPGGHPARAGLAAPALLVAPGYLLLQAFLVPKRSARARAVHGLVSLGVSPAVLGLLALATALVPGGFQEGAIVTLTALACLGLAGLAVTRRSRHGHAPSRGPHAEETAS